MCEYFGSELPGSQETNKQPLYNIYKIECELLRLLFKIIALIIV